MHHQTISHIQLLAKEFNIEAPQQALNGSLKISNIYEFLESLEREMEKVKSRHSEDYFISINPDITNAITSLTHKELHSKNYGIGYDLQLWCTNRIVNPNNYPNVFELLIKLPEKNTGLAREDHGYGYHIHYIIVKKRKELRSDIILTFNPKEPLDVQHHLYWEKHSGDISSQPELFGDRRCNSIYDTSCSFLNQIPKSKFKQPSDKSNRLWPK